MTGLDRRKAIIQQMEKSKQAISGTTLATAYHVSRQVIVQDIALIRASGYDILSTNKGYLLNKPQSVNRIWKVSAENEEVLDLLEEELKEKGFLTN